MRPECVPATAAGSALRSVSSLAFAGPDPRGAILGCLLGDSLAGFPVAVAGHPPVHGSWTG